MAAASMAGPLVAAAPVDHAPLWLLSASADAYMASTAVAAPLVAYIPVAATSLAAATGGVMGLFEDH